MSRRCLICSDINPCPEHPEAQQAAALEHNIAAIAALRSESTPFPAEPLEGVTAEPDTKIDIAELRGLLEKATAGEWRREAMGGSSTVLCVAQPVRNDNRIPPYGYRVGGDHCLAYPALSDADQADVRWDYVSFSHDDAALIAAMKRALPSLLDQLEQSQREVERLNAPDDLEDRKAELMVPLTDEMARAQADLYLDMKARAEASQARVAELTAEVERLELDIQAYRASEGALAEDLENERTACRDYQALVARLRGALEPALAAAYEEGCIATHKSIQAEPELALMPVESAEFGEAATDYAQAARQALQEGK